MQDASTSSRIFALAFLCALLLQTTFAQAQLANSTWPMFMHDLRHTGRTTVNGPSTSAVSIKWAYKADSRIKTSPTISGDGSTIYLGAGFAPLCAVNSTNGAEKWCTTGGGDAAISSPTVANDGTIYIGARDNRLWSVHDGGPNNPQVNWKYKIFLDGDVKSSPAIDPSGNAVYMSCGCLTAGIVHALDPHTVNPAGELIWDLKVGKSTKTSAPAIDTTGGLYQGTIYIGSTDGKLHALNPNPPSPPDGSLKWSVSVGTINTNPSSPSIADDGTIYIGTAQGVAAVHPQDGHMLLGWPFLTNGKVSATPALGASGAIYVGTLKGSFYAINANGAPKWTQPLNLGGEVLSSAAIGQNGKIYVAAGKTVYCIDDNGTSGAIRWSFTTKKPFQWSSPAIGPDGTLYIGSTDKNLYALIAN